MIVGISKCYNEEKIAQETLDHYAQWCDKMVIYDDCSTDSTKDILRKSDKVILIEGTVRGENRREEDYNNRQKALDKARELNTDWYLIFDFDERIEQFPEIEEYSESFSMRLFDAYITEGDKDKDYKSREWFWPEVREIINLIRADKIIGFHAGEGVDYERVPECKDTMSVTKAWYIKHYGKAESIEEWEKTCEYYSHWLEPYKSKWEARRGKAIHTKSDFDRPLYRWNYLLNNPEVWVFI